MTYILYEQRNHTHQININQLKNFLYFIECF